MHRIQGLFLLAVLALCASARAHAAGVDLATFDVVDIPPTAARADGPLPIRAFGRSFALELRPNDRLLAPLPAAQRERIPAADAFFTGELAGVPGSWVRLNRIGGRFSGGFFDGNELYLIDRAGGFPITQAAGIAPDRTIVFRFSDLKADFLIDHGGVRPGAGPSTATPASDYRIFVQHLREIAGLRGSPMLAMPVTIVSDVQFTGDHGGNVASVVAGRANFVDGIYASQLGTGIQLFHHEILTDNGPLVDTDAGDLLLAFRQYMTGGAGGALPFAGLGHLFTGRDLNGGTVGIAYVGVLCSASFGYGVNQNLNNDTTSALVFAHELGHNFNAPHDGEGACSAEPFRGIMNPSINGSQQFSDCSLDIMGQAAAAASCLVEVDDPQPVFADGFEIP